MTTGNPLRIADESGRKPILCHNVQYASKKRITCLYFARVSFQVHCLSAWRPQKHVLGDGILAGAEKSTQIRLI